MSSRRLPGRPLDCQTCSAILSAISTATEPESLKEDALEAVGGHGDQAFAESDRGLVRQPAEHHVGQALRAGLRPRLRCGDADSRESSTTRTTCRPRARVRPRAASAHLPRSRPRRAVPPPARSRDAIRRDDLSRQEWTYVSNQEVRGLKRSAVCEAGCPAPRAAYNRGNVIREPETMSPGLAHYRSRSSARSRCSSRSPVSASTRLACAPLASGCCPGPLSCSARRS